VADARPRLGFSRIQGTPEAVELPAPPSDRPIAEDYLPTALNELDLDSLLVAPATTGVQQECVLLIEDSEEAMLLVRYSLQAYGDGRYRLKWVESLSEGLVQLSKGGVEVPTLVLTGDTREETEFAAAAWGVDDYLVKDQVSGAELVHVVRTLIDTRRMQKRRTATDDRLMR